MVFNVNELMKTVEKLRKTISFEEMYFFGNQNLDKRNSSPDEDELKKNPYEPSNWHVREQSRNTCISK